MENQVGKRMLRQITMQRYKHLIQRVKKVYNLRDEQVQKLETKILNVDWLHRATF
jgi:hypothetical protein